MMESPMLSGSCRCCASEGAYKDVKSSYHWMGEEEIYADMLKDCFDISLSSPSDGQEEGGICEICITQLRNAANFRKQVLHTEEQFKNRLQIGIFKPELVKVEIPGEDENDSDDNNASADEVYSGPEFEVPIKSESPEEPKPKKRAAKKATTTRAKKAKTDDAETSTKRQQQLSAIKSEIKEFEESDSEIYDDSFRMKETRQKTPRTELVKHRSNIKEILTNSNATPIRRYGGIGYTCCFCTQQFPEPGDLKKHTLEAHNDIMQANFMKSMNMSEYVIKLDITALRCNICLNDIDSLEQMMQHLEVNHEKKIFTDIKNHIMPFKFNEETLRCSICSSYFNKFRMLLKHMHIHYRNFICDVCDVGFINRNGLSQHSENHKTGKFGCHYCPKVFTTHVKKKLHERNSHTHVDLLNKCGYCNETFKDYRKKEAHLAEMHGVRTQTPKCQACDKTFSNRKVLNIHIKRDHLMERPHDCPQCDMKFFSTTGLKNHIVKHTGLRAFQCEVCLKSFGRKKTLNSHSRIHDDDRRYKCEHCGQAFVQKCSWRGHMRSKHGEIV